MFLEKKKSLSDFNRKVGTTSFGVIWQIIVEETAKSEIISPLPPFASCLLWTLYLSWCNCHPWEPSTVPVCSGAVGRVGIWGVRTHWNWWPNLLSHCGNEELYRMNLKPWRSDSRREGDLFLERDFLQSQRSLLGTAAPSAGGLSECPQKPFCWTVTF